MRRYAEEKHIIRRRVKESRLFSVRAVGHFAPGKMRKRKPNDCGNTRCGICHYSKLINDKPHSQAKADLSAREQIAEVPTSEDAVIDAINEALFRELHEYDTYWDKLDSLLEKYPCDR